MIIILHLSKITPAIVNNDRRSVKKKKKDPTRKFPAIW